MMTVSIMYKVVDPNEGQRLVGTSSDLAALQRVWSTGILDKNSIPTLQAMDAAICPHTSEGSFWEYLASILEDLPDGVKIKVWGEY